MRLVYAKTRDESKNWQKGISQLPVLKTYRVRPIDVEKQGNSFVVSIIDVTNKGVHWDRYLSGELISNLEAIGIACDNVEVSKTAFGLDLSFVINYATM